MPRLFDYVEVCEFGELCIDKADDSWRKVNYLELLIEEGHCQKIIDVCWLVDLFVMFCTNSWKIDVYCCFLKVISHQDVW